MRKRECVGWPGIVPLPSPGFAIRLGEAATELPAPDIDPRHDAGPEPNLKAGPPTFAARPSARRVASGAGPVFLVRRFVSAHTRGFLKPARPPDCLSCTGCTCTDTSTHRSRPRFGDLRCPSRPLPPIGAFWTRGDPPSPPSLFPAAAEMEALRRASATWQTDGSTTQHSTDNGRPVGDDLHFILMTWLGL
jgi:hypothetical protein